MKLLYLALPLLSSLAIAQSLAEDDCQCPQVKCPSTDTFEGCRCVNLAELRCKKQCPTYKPTKFKICSLPQQPSTAPTSTPTPVPLPLPLPPAVDVPVLAEPEPGSSPSSLPPILSIPVPVIPVPLPAPAAPPNAVLPDKPPVPGCVCEQMMCIQSYPNSCHCEYGIAKNCYDKCGGKSPGPNTCPPLGSVGSPSLFDGPVKRVASPEPQASTSLIPVGLPVNVPASPQRPPSTGISSASCTCEERFCIQSFPASCHCANRNKNRCWMKCGGPKPLLQNCLAPVIPPKVPTETGGTHQVCGGGRANSLQCPTGYICMNDPFKSGCGLECDGTGICVQDQLCGGFAGFKCPNSGQVCVDRPDDGCDPKNGGADCGGVCVWPPSLRTG